MKTLPFALALALIASLFTVTATTAWDVKTSCGTIEYNGYAYRIAGGDWTTSDSKVAAGSYTVEFKNGEKQKVHVPACPQPRELNVVVRGMLCGDPRASWKFVNKGDVPATFLWSWLPGNKSISTRKSQAVTVQPGASRKILHRWVRGWVAMRVFDPALDRYVALSDASYRVGTTLETSRWGTNGCPSGLRGGSPDFRKAHVLDRYANEW